MDHSLQGRLRSVHLPAVKKARFLPIALLFAMACAIILLDAILPLRSIMFNDALLAHLSSWFLLPTHMLFPGGSIYLVVPGIHIPKLLLDAHNLKQIALLPGALLIMFALYLLALRWLPAYIGRRFLLSSTLLLGALCVLIPVVTSSDVFSYITYARIGVIYHLNPLTTLPSAISSDVISPYIYWNNQPSAYGPVWTVITCSLQWLLNLVGSGGILPMLLALRLFGLAMHLGCTLLIWLIGGHLQRLIGVISSEKRMRATLAFAWNPLLLIEACVNAHNDTTVLFFILFGIWFLVRTTQPTIQNLMLAAAMFALATCVKINIILLVPGLLFFLSMQRPWHMKRIVAAAASYGGIILLLYAPFWQGGAVLQVFSVNPATNRNINTVYELLSQFYNVSAHVRAPTFGQIILSTPVERMTHIISTAIFMLIYAILCLRVIRVPQRINTIPGLIRWMAIVWLLYCAIGSPWFWPWYLVTFFGLYALIEACTGDSHEQRSFLRLPLAVRLLAFSMLSLYCFYTWIPLHTSIPGFRGFNWAYLRSLWTWGLPLLAIRLPPRQSIRLLPFQSHEPPRAQRQEVPVLRS